MSVGRTTPVELLKDALAGLHVRIPRSAEEAAALRAEVRAADAALGVALRAAADEQRRPTDDGEQA